MQLRPQCSASHKSFHKTLRHEYWPELQPCVEIQTLLVIAVEAAEQARFLIPAVEFNMAHAALSNILSPLQSARLLVTCRTLYMALPGVLYEATGLLRFIAACFLDEELGSWLVDTELLQEQRQ